MNIKLVIFDLDGTLLNTISDLGQSVNYVLQKYNYPTHSLEQYKYFVGNGITKLIERALPKEMCNDIVVAKLQSDFVEYYTQHSKDQTKPYEGIVDLIDELKKRNITLAVASNKHHPATVALIDYYFKTDTFDLVYGKREGVNPKPDPTIVNDIIQQFKIAKEDILYVGDSSIDMQTAKNASVTSVGVTWGFRTKQELIENGANYLIDSPMELINIIDKQ